MCNHLTHHMLLQEPAWLTKLSRPQSTSTNELKVHLCIEKQTRLDVGPIDPVTVQLTCTSKAAQYSDLNAVSSVIQTTTHAALGLVSMIGLLLGLRLGGHPHRPNGQVCGIDQPERHEHAHQQW